MKKIYILLVMLLSIGLSYGQLSGVSNDDGTPAVDNINLNFVSSKGLDSPTVLPDYYNYNTEGNGGNSFPWNIPGGKMVQILFLAGDFNQPTSAPAGNITALAFRLRSGYPIGPWTYSQLTIKMGQSTITTLPASFYTGALTTVYFRASVSLTGPAGDWMFITLDTPFAYDPTQSLIVDIGHCGAPGATGFSSCYTNTPGSSRRNYSVGGCPFVYSGVSTYVYNVGFTMSTAVLPPTVVTTAATSITTTGATLNGTVNANGSSTVVTFEYGLTTGYGSTVTAIQSPVTGSTVTPVSAPVTGLVPNTLYHYRVKGVNSGGTSNGNDMTFTTLAAPPIVVTNDAAPVGTTSATLNGTVTAQNASTTVTFQWGLTPAFGNVATAAQSPVTGSTATSVSANLTGLTTLATYYFRCVGVNSAGTTNGATLSFVPGCPTVPQAGPITGSTSVCANSAGNVYSITALPNATSYTWSVPPGATITAGTNTTSITVTFGSTSGNVSVYGSSSCATGMANSKAVTVNQLPAPTITGTNNMCVNLAIDYSTEAGFSNYVWNVSSGGTITGGTGTNQISVIWNTGGAQTVSVNYTNAYGCAALAPTSFPVTVNPLPGAAGVITGTANVCKGSNGISYSVSPISNAVAYVWSLPAGATIATGVWTNTITVNFDANASSGNITVYGNNLCGNGAVSPDFPVSVLTIPGDAGAITGPGNVCAGASGIGFSVAPISGATGYNWTLPFGASIVSGANTANIFVDFASNAVSGIFTVTGTNMCGSGTVSPALSVTVLPKPVPPVITVDGFTLSSNYTEGNQWYYNGAIITSGTGQTLEAAYSGWYWDIVTIDGCSSDSSNNLYMVVTGIDEKGNSELYIYPVPNDGRFTVTCHELVDGNLTLEVFNYLGIRIYDIRVEPVQGTLEQSIDLRPVPNGVYTVVLRTDDNRVVRRILVNK